METNGAAHHATGQSRHVDQINAIAGIGTPTNLSSSCSTLKKLSLVTVAST